MILGTARIRRNEGIKALKQPARPVQPTEDDLIVGEIIDDDDPLL